MAIIASLDVAIRASTEQFEAGFSKSADTLSRFSTSVEKVEAKVAKAARLLEQQAITPEQFAETMRNAERELAALGQGFRSAADAAGQAEAVTKQNQTATEQYAAELQRMERLVRSGALSYSEYGKAVNRITEAMRAAEAAAAAMQPTMADTTAAAAGFRDFADAASRAKSVLSGLRTEEERHEARLAELRNLFKAGAISGQEYTQSLDRLSTAFKSSQSAAASLKPSVQDLVAVQHGFRSMADASQRAEAVLKNLETAEERHAARLKELQALFRSGAFKSIDDYNRAVQRTQKAYYDTIPYAQLVGSEVDKLGLRFANQIPVVGRFSHLFAGMSTPIGAAVAALVGVGVAVGAAAAGFRMLWSHVSRAVERLDEIGDAADRLGIATSEFQRLAYAAELSDTTFEAVASGIAKMGRGISEAMSNAKAPIGKVFADLKLNAADLSRLTPEQAFIRLSEAIRQIERPFTRSRIAFELFGKQYRELMPLIMRGADGLRAMGDEAEKTGNAFRDIDGVKIDMAAQSIKRLGKAVEGLSNTLAVGLSPAIIGVTKLLTQFSTEALQSPAVAMLKFGQMAQDASDIAAAGGWAKAIMRAVQYGKAVGEATQQAKQDIEAAAQAEAKLGKQINPDAIERYSTAISDLEKRQKSLSDESAKASESLSKQRQKWEADQQRDMERGGIRIAAPSDEWLTDLENKVAAGKPIKLPVKANDDWLTELEDKVAAGKPVQIPATIMAQVDRPIDMDPLRTLRDAQAAIEKQVAQGALTPTQAESQMDAAVTAADEALARLKEYQDKLLEAKRQEADREREIHQQRMTNLRQMQDMIDAANPLLAVEQKLADTAARINDLHKAGLITDERRAELLDIAAENATQDKTDAIARMNAPAAAAEDALRQRRDELVASMQRRKELENILPDLTSADSALKTRAEALAKPFEAFIDAVDELQRMRKLGLIDEATFSDAMQQARKTAVEQSVAETMPRVEPPSALERGTQAAFQAFQKNLDAQQRIDKQVEEQRKTNAKLTEIARKRLVVAEAKL